MFTVKTTDLKNDFKKISDLVMTGERVVIARPHNENLVVMSEAAYNELEKIRRNNDYIDKIEKRVNEIEQGKVINISLEELEAMETMSSDEAKAHIEIIKRSQGFLLKDLQVIPVICYERTHNLFLVL